ncbi:MAG TPA: hypothetical protein VMD28_10070 [Acidimicrobiales bacterium]|nr:hypothetical protein [Acidimicrobiales bacterium]
MAAAVLGRFLGGYGGAVVIGAGIGLVALSLGKRRPHHLHDQPTDAPEDDRW